MRKAELLAPAGNAVSLIAAVQSGADAVYIGGANFSARQSADNFSTDEIKRCADYCHLYGVNVYAAVNTLIKERELNSLIDYVYELNRAGVDALIIQDVGAAELIKNALPDMRLHASTQMTVTSLEGVRYLENMGFSRVVLARELTEKEIERICAGAKAEIEVFVHGAICMCYSGQCLMSSVIGGRSGNRGRCAQPCRLPYELVRDSKTEKSGCLLSPKDLALINELQKLREIGVTSFKIEGRLKKAEYVSAVVGIYRKYLDSGGKISDADMKELSDAFSRGFTDGYFKGKLGADIMSGASARDAKTSAFSSEAKRRADINANVRKIPVSITGTLKRDMPFEVEIIRDTKRGFARGTLKSETAINRPIDAERIKSQLMKLGDTPFEAVDVTVSVDEGITLPIKEINEVRRAAVAELTEKLQHRARGRENKTEIKRFERGDTKIELTVEASTIEQAGAAAKNGIKTVYAPKAVADIIKIEYPEINAVVKTAEIFSGEEVNADAVLVSSPADISFYAGKEIYGDFRLNVFNSQTANRYRNLKSVTLSPELNLGEIRDITRNTDASIEVIGYGRLPLMITRNCPVKSVGKCQRGKMHYSLRDRKKEEFPLMCAEGCAMKILNSKPIFMADKMRGLKNLKINTIRLIFTVENFAQCDKIISVYKSALDGDTVEGLAENSFTRGHYYRGAE